MKILENHNNFTFEQMDNFMINLEKTFNCFRYDWYNSYNLRVILLCDDCDLNNEVHDTVYAIIRYNVDCYSTHYTIQINNELMSEEFANKFVEHIITNLKDNPEN